MCSIWHPEETLLRTGLTDSAWDSQGIRHDHPTLWILNAKTRSCASGEFPHAERVLPALYELMERDEAIEKTALPVAASTRGVKRAVRH